MTSLDAVVSAANDYGVWLAVKLAVMLRIDSEEQYELFVEYRELMIKAIQRGFDEADGEIINQYLDPPAAQRPAYIARKGGLRDEIYFPVETDGPLWQVSQAALEGELMRRFYVHLITVATGQGFARICEAPECSQIFASSRRQKRFCCASHREREKQRRLRRRRKPQP